MKTIHGILKLQVNQTCEKPKVSAFQKALSAQGTPSSSERGQGGKQPALLPFPQASVARSPPHRKSSGRGTGREVNAEILPCKEAGDTVTNVLMK